MHVTIRGKKKVRLAQRDFVARGGEGDVYAKGDLAFKIYLDPARMLSQAKIAELSCLSLANIIKPLDIVEDDSHTAIGFTMRAVSNAIPLARTIAPGFRTREGLTPATMLALVEALRSGVSHVHSKGVLIVDLNEMNVLVGARYDELFFIDVDSYQTRSFPATAIMDSVRDRHATGFDAGTDWFAFAVVAFTMFVGIHPYKGTYAPHAGATPRNERLDARMKANISVLNPDVRVPPSTLPFSVIPKAYRDWFEAVFERGLRQPPPDGPQAHAALAWAPVAQAVEGAGLIDLRELGRFDGAVVAVLDGVVLTTRAVFVDRRRAGSAEAQSALGSLPRSGRVVVAHLADGRLGLRDVGTGRAIPCEIRGQKLVASEGRLYLKSDATILEVDFLETATATIAGARVAANVLDHATQLFEGVAIENLLGAVHAVVFAGPRVAHRVRIRELDGYRLVDARYQRGVLAVAAEKAGRYDELVFRFDERFASYDVRVVEDTAPDCVNFTVLDSGVCLRMSGAESLEIFHSKKGSDGLKVMTDKTLDTTARLFSVQGRAAIAIGGSLFSATLARPGSAGRAR